MNLELLHPKIVHVPIALAVLMPLLSFGVLLAWWRSWLPRRTWIIAAALQGVLVAASFAALQTGEVDEEVVEAVVAEQFLDAHEEAAELFMWIAAIALLFYVGAAAIKNERVARGLGALSVLASLVVFAQGYRVGEAGGALVYEHGAAGAFTAQSAGAAPTGGGAEGATPARQGDHDDDDD